MSIVTTDAYGRSIDATDNGDGTTSYSSGGISIRLSSTAPLTEVVSSFNSMMPSIDQLPLPEAMQIKIEYFEEALQDYADRKYDLKTQFNFFVMRTLAIEAGRTNQLAYINQAIAWAGSIMAYNVSVIGQIMALTTSADVANFTWDIDAGVMPDPQITLLAASQIPN